MWPATIKLDTTPPLYETRNMSLWQLGNTAISCESCSYSSSKLFQRNAGAEALRHHCVPGSVVELRSLLLLLLCRPETVKPCAVFVLSLAGVSLQLLCAVHPMPMHTRMHRQLRARCFTTTSA